MTSPRIAHRRRPTVDVRHPRHEPFAARPWGFVQFSCGHCRLTNTPNWSMICPCERPGPHHVILLDHPH